MMRAGFVLSFMHISSSVSRPPSTPCVYVSGSSVSSPGIPIGIFVQSPSHIAFCSRVKVQVSVEITDTSPLAQPLPQPLRVRRLLELRAAGEQVAVLALEHRVVEHEVLHARLGEHRHAARLRRADDVGAFGGRHVHDVELPAGRLAPAARRAGSPRPR